MYAAGHGTLSAWRTRLGAALGTRIFAWALLVVVALFVLKFAFGLVLGLIQFVITLAVLAVVALGVSGRYATSEMPYLIICLFFGLAGGLIGRMKGSSFVLWFLISAIVPVLGLLAAVLYRFETDEVRRQCPRCGKVVKLYDQVCMRCGEDMDFPERPSSPSPSPPRAASPSAERAR